MVDGVWIGIPQFSQLSLKDRKLLRDRLRDYVNIKLGHKGGERNPEAYRRKLEFSKAWNHKNLDSIKAASQRKRDKHAAEGFGSSHRDDWLHKISKEKHGRTNDKTT